MVPPSLRSAFLFLVLGAWSSLQAMERVETAAVKEEASETAQADLCVICQENMALAPHIQAEQLMQVANQDMSEIEQQYQQRMQSLTAVCIDTQIDLPLREAAKAELTQEEDKHRSLLQKREVFQRLIQEISLKAIECILHEMQEQHTQRMAILTLPVKIPHVKKRQSRY